MSIVTRIFDGAAASARKPDTEHVEHAQKKARPSARVHTAK